MSLTKDAHCFDVPLSGRLFPDFDSKSWLYEAWWGEREARLPASRSLMLWRSPGPIGPEQAAKSVFVSDHDFDNDTPNSEAWLGANASEALDLFGHTPAHSCLPGGAVVIPGARVFNRRLFVLTLTFKEGADMGRPTWDLEPYDGLFAAGTRFLFARVKRA